MGYIVNVVLENRMFSALVLFSGIILIIVLRSDNMRRQLKKGISFLLILLGLGLGYYFLTGKSLTEIPSAINTYFNGPQAAPEEHTKRYYKEPEDRYGKQLTD